MDRVPEQEEEERNKIGREMKNPCFLWSRGFVFGNECKFIAERRLHSGRGRGGGEMALRSLRAERPVPTWSHGTAVGGSHGGVSGAM